MGKVQKSTKAARGTVTCDNTTMHLLKTNDFVAESIRKQMKEKNILMKKITSSAGSGKTTLLQETARRIGDKVNMKILVGDLETERDADRLREVGVDALQIVTGGICHLEAQMIWQGMESLDLDGVELLIVENVVADARDVNPSIQVMEISSTTDVGIEEWCDWLLDKVKEKQNSVEHILNVKE